MSTSLQKQLLQLSTPQTSLLKVRNSRASLLFDTREAALLDRDVVFQLGVEGFDQLEALDSTLHVFRQPLFSTAVKCTERAVLTRHDNAQLDHVIDHCLCHISPYLLLKPAQKALEWLIYRFHVHQYNVDSLLRCALPYHDSPLFVRLLQLLDLAPSAAPLWHWLQCLQRPGTPLAKLALYTQCARDVGLLNFICTMNKKIIKIRGAAARGLEPAIVFYVSTVSGTLRVLSDSSAGGATGGGVSERQMALLLPHVLRGLRSSVPSLRAGTCLLLTQLLIGAGYGQQLGMRLLSEQLVQVLFTALVKNALGGDGPVYMGTLAVLCASHQLVEAPAAAVQLFCQHADTLLPPLAALAQTKSPLCLVLCLLRGAMRAAVRENDHTAVAMATTLVDDVTFVSVKHQRAVIDLLFAEYLRTETANNNNKSKTDDTDCSDEEEVVMEREGDGVTAAVSMERCLSVVCPLLQLLRRRYPIAWQHSIKTTTAAAAAPAAAVAKGAGVTSSLQQLLAAVDSELQSQQQLLQLFHPHETVRQLAASTLFQQLTSQQKLESLSAERLGTCRQAVITCLTMTTDTPSLISAALSLPIDTLISLVGAEKLVELLCRLMANAQLITSSAPSSGPPLGHLCTVALARAVGACTSGAPSLPPTVACSLLTLVSQQQQQQQLSGCHGDSGGLSDLHQHISLLYPAVKSLTSHLTSTTNVSTTSTTTTTTAVAAGAADYMTSLITCMTSQMTLRSVCHLLRHLVSSSHQQQQQQQQQRQCLMFYLAAASLCSSYLQLVDAAAAARVDDKKEYKSGGGVEEQEEEEDESRVVFNMVLYLLTEHQHSAAASSSSAVACIISKLKWSDAVDWNVSPVDLLQSAATTTTGNSSSSSSGSSGSTVLSPAVLMSQAVLCVVRCAVQFCHQRFTGSDKWRHLLVILFNTACNGLASGHSRSRSRPLYTALIELVLSAVAQHTPPTVVTPTTTSSGHPQCEPADDDNDEADKRREHALTSRLLFLTAVCNAINDAGGSGGKSLLSSVGRVSEPTRLTALLVAIRLAQVDYQHPRPLLPSVVRSGNYSLSAAALAALMSPVAQVREAALALCALISRSLKSPARDSMDTNTKSLPHVLSRVAKIAVDIKLDAHAVASWLHSGARDWCVQVLFAYCYTVNTTSSSSNNNSSSSSSGRDSVGGGGTTTAVATGYVFDGTSCQLHQLLAAAVHRLNGSQLSTALCWSTRLLTSLASSPTTATSPTPPTAPSDPANCLTLQQRHLLAAQLTMFTPAAARALHGVSPADTELVSIVLSRALHCHVPCLPPPALPSPSHLPSTPSATAAASSAAVAVAGTRDVDKYDATVSPHQFTILTATGAFVSALPVPVCRQLVTYLLSAGTEAHSPAVVDNVKKVLITVPDILTILAETLQQALPAPRETVKEARKTRRKKITTTTNSSSSRSNNNNNKTAVQFDTCQSLTTDSVLKRRLVVILETIQLYCSSVAAGAAGGGGASTVVVTDSNKTPHSPPQFGCLLPPLFRLLRHLQSPASATDTADCDDGTTNNNTNSSGGGGGGDDTSSSSWLHSEQLQLLALATVQLVVGQCCEHKQLAATSAAGAAAAAGGGGAGLEVDTLVHLVRHSHCHQVVQHTLHVLCQLAAVLPDVVLHSVMAVFTFVGSSLLRQDNDFTFGVIEQTLDSVIPAVLKAQCGSSSVSDTLGASSHSGRHGGATVAVTTASSDQSATASPDAFVTVLRVFCDAALDIPRHRCVPLFVRLLRGGDKYDAPAASLLSQLHLWRMIALFMAQLAAESDSNSGRAGNSSSSAAAAAAAAAASGRRHGNKQGELSELCQTVCCQFDLATQLEALHQLLLMVSALVHNKLDCKSGGSSMDCDSDSNTRLSQYTQLFDISRHTDKQTYRFCVGCVTFVSTLLTSDSFVEQNLLLCSEQQQQQQLRCDTDDQFISQLLPPPTAAAPAAAAAAVCHHYQLLFQTAVSLISSCSRYRSRSNNNNNNSRHEKGDDDDIGDEGEHLSVEHQKFCRVVLHKTNNLLDTMNGLLPADLFVATVCALLSDQSPHSVIIRRKAVEMLVMRVQQQLQQQQQQQQQQHQRRRNNVCSVEPFVVKHHPALLLVLKELTRCVELPVSNQLSRHHITDNSDGDIDGSTGRVGDIDGSTGRDGDIDGSVGRDAVVSQQMALFTIKLLVKLLADDNAAQLLPVMKSVLSVIKSLVSAAAAAGAAAGGAGAAAAGHHRGGGGGGSSHQLLLSSALLCVAQLCSSLGARAVVHVTTTVSALLSVLQRPRLISNELVAVATVTAIHKLIGALAPFLSPHLPELLLHICRMSVTSASTTTTTTAAAAAEAVALKSNNRAQSSSGMAGSLQVKLRLARSQLSGVCVRLLLPACEECLHQLTLDGATEPAHYSLLCQLLTECVTKTDVAQLTASMTSLQTIMLRLLDCRRLSAKYQLSSPPAAPSAVDQLECDVIHLVTSLVPRLSENTFRPLFLRVQEWALTDAAVTTAAAGAAVCHSGIQNGHPDGAVGHSERVVTFFRLVDALADTLRGLFVLFAGHFYDQLVRAIELTNSCSHQKQNGADHTLPDNEELQCQLIEFCLDSLNKICLYDTEGFISADRFQRMMQPLIDQLENQLGSEQRQLERVQRHLVPCVVNFLMAPSDHVLWKTANYQILLKLRHSSPQVRLAALNTLAALVERLQDDYASLLPETMPFFGELLEDDDERVEQACQKLIQDMEQSLGESLQKYL